ncbi:MAG: thiamine phosphate synthase [Austwickia sp.]|nr:MAG: thiamine phosphate synthase [Austwickia sp.]
MSRTHDAPAAAGSDGTGRAGRPRLDLSVYLVTDTAQCGDLGVPETVRRAVSAGVTLVQLRDPDCSDDEFVRLGQAVAGALAGSGVPLLLNDRVHLVAAVGADGAHVGQGDMPVRRARELLGPDALLGLSVNTATELAAARADDPTGEVIDYLGLGIYRATATKPDHAPAEGLANIRALAAASPWPTCAIGGVKAADAGALRGAGVDGMAVVSAICGCPDVAAATRELAQAWAAAGVRTGSPARPDVRTGSPTGPDVRAGSPTAPDVRPDAPDGRA